MLCFKSAFGLLLIGLLVSPRVSGASAPEGKPLFVGQEDCARHIYRLGQTDLAPAQRKWLLTILGYLYTRTDTDVYGMYQCRDSVPDLKDVDLLCNRKMKPVSRATIENLFQTPAFLQWAGADTINLLKVPPSAEELSHLTADEFSSRYRNIQSILQSRFGVSLDIHRTGDCDSDPATD
jgi:hypothetical protein